MYPECSGVVLARIFVFVHTQGSTYNSIEAAVSDATREVNARRSGGLRQVQEATSGTNSLEGITSHSAVHVPKCARYHSQRQAPGLDKAISYAGDMAITATAKYAERLVHTFVITNFPYWISLFVGVVQP
ncbi:Hypothetical predicted protein [Mytilus galloprovincialis]|uniref:Uncharacterized protein n=1 Tax=Mytilus galloprovincialis TaxID=29158 RepID=A0A8B6CWM9_MYTGA|nr:Hypothetical predicted protein [Mytilus galloprovincialis]